MTGEVVAFQQREKALVLRTLIQQLAEAGWSSRSASNAALRHLQRVDLGSNRTQLDFSRLIATLTLGVIVSHMLVDAGYGTTAHYSQVRLRAVLKECTECQRLQGIIEAVSVIAEEKAKVAEVVYIDRLRDEKERLFRRIDATIVEAITASMEAVSMWADVADDVSALKLNPDLTIRDGALTAFAEESIQILVSMGIPTALEFQQTG